MVYAPVPSGPAAPAVPVSHASAAGLKFADMSGAENQVVDVDVQATIERLRKPGGVHSNQIPGRVGAAAFVVDENALHCGCRHRGEERVVRVVERTVVDIILTNRFPSQG